MIALGVDPGLTGAIAAVCLRRGLLDVADLPTCSNGLETGSLKRWINVGALDEMLSDWARRHDFAREHVETYVERPIAMPNLPAQTIAAQFDTVGAVRAVLEIKGLRASMVTPNEWKRFYRLGKDKGEARATAQSLYPDAPINRVKDHNRAEAILIARYALRTNA